MAGTGDEGSDERQVLVDGTHFAGGGGGVLENHPAAAAALVALLSLAPSVAAQSPALSFGSAAVESKLYDTGTAITPIVLPEATGGAGTLSYTLSPATLPRGLTWTASTRTIAGTPTAVTAATTYTWQATDGDGDRATLTFSLRVWAPAGPAVDGTSVRLETVNGRTKYNYWPGEAIWFLVQYPEKVAVTGTPQVTLVVGDRKRKADYSAADTAWLRLATNDDPYDLLIFTYTVRADDFDGDGIAVPADALSLNGGTIRAVDGGADAKLSLGTHAVANGDATSVQMRVRDTAPAFSQSASAANRSFALNAATSTTLPRATGDGALTYAVSPALPRGLSLASASPKITGTPRVAGATTHTLTATDADGDRTALGPFTITVAAASAPKPSALTLSPPPGFDGDYAAGEVIRAFVSFDKGVTVTGAPRLALTIGANTRQASYHAAGSDSDDLSFRYTVTSSDFDGDGISIGDAALTLNGGAIAGTAAGAAAAALDLSGYAVANAAGHTVRDTQPSFGSASVSARNYPKDTAVDESLPAATGGDGTLRYTLRPALPRGLSFDPAGRRIHGTPGVRAPPATYTYRATDGDGDAAALTFLLAVTDVPAVSAVRVSSSPASGDAYGALETISVDVRFDQAVTVTAPNPSLALTVGARTRSAAFAGKPNASTLRFSYRVQASDDDDDGIGVAAGALTLNGAGKLRDATGTRDAALALGTHAIANAAGHQVDTPPKISGVAITSRPTNGNYAAGDVIAARLTFTESVFVRRNPPTVALTIGANTRTATWHGGPSIGGPNTHTFAYTVQSSDFDGDGISIAAGAVTANSGFLAHSRDDPNRRALVGLGSHAIANDANHRVRDTAPTFAAAVAAQHYVAGAAASLTLPAATGDGAISYQLTGALPGGLIYRSADRRISGTPQAAAAASAQTWVATDADGDATTLTFTITVAAAGAPKVSALTFLSTPRRGATYAVGETIVAGIKFDKSVTMTGSPRLALSIGGVTRYATLFSRPSRVTRWHHPFTYTVRSVDRDTDGISIGASALSLNGGSIVRSNDASVAASLALGSFAVANAAGHKVDGGTNQPPAVRSVSVDSWPVASAGYAAGDVIRLNVGFSEPLVVTGSPRLALGIGTNTRQAAFDRAAHKQLYFRYTVQVSDHDADGISVAANALTLPDGAAVRDAAGADAALGLGSRALSNLSAHKVSTPPKVTGLAIVSTPQQAGTYTRGGVITARVTFDQSVTVTGSPALALTIGADTRAATAAAGSGNAYLDFSYTVAAADADADGLGITGAALTLPSGAAIRDADGAGAVLDLGSYAATRFANAKVDGSKTGLWPDFGAAAGPDLSIGKNVTVTYLLDPACGPVPVGCSLAASHTGDAPLAYTVSPPLPSGLNLYRGTAVLVGAATVASPSTRYTLTVTDANGDTDTLTFTLAVTGDRPTVHGVSFRSSPAAASTYGRGEEIRVAVRFRRQGGGALAVTGSPRLALRIGSVTRQAAYYGVSGDGVLFRYAVQAADRDADGVSIAAGALTLNGGAIRDRAGNAALLGLGRHRVANHASHKVDGGIRRAPSVTGVTISTSPATGDTYSRGEAIEVAVRFSQGVGVTGTPRLALGIGSAARYANYDRAGATSATQYFRYVVRQADVDADGLSIGTGALTLNGGAIRNNQGTNAALGLGRHAISNAANAKVNGAVNSPAIVTGVAITSRPAKGDTFRLGEEIRVRVTFSKAVVASRRTYRQGNPGWPRLALTVGSRTHRAALQTSVQWGSQPAGTTLAFHYTVQAGDYDGDGLGIAAAALDANLGSIRHGGVDANLSLGRHAVSAAAFKVDGRRPSVSGVSITSRPGAGDTYAAGEVIHAAITFDMPVRVPVGPYPGGSPTLALAVGRNTRQMTYTGSGASAIGFRYAVQAGDRDPDGVSVVTRGGLDLKGLAITAAASGNPAVTDLSGFTGHGGAGQKVDGAARPPVVRTLVMSSPQRGSTFDRHEEIGINVRFSQDLTVTGTPQLSLVIGSRTKTLNMARSFGSYLRFVYEVQAGDADADGVVVPANSLALNGGTIRNRHGVDAALGHLVYRPPLNVDGAANHPPVAIRAGFAGRPIGGVYGRGDMIDVVVNWGKRVTVTGTPQLALDVGAGTRQAALQSGNQLYSRFRYVVQSGDLDNDGIGFGSGALTLNGGSISGPGGTTANLTLPAAATDANRRVDGRILPQPAFTGSVTARTWTVGSSVSYALPAATGARGTIGYAMRQRLPDGLEFSAASRTITGTPTTVTPRATYTLQATDSATNAQGTLDFSIEITPNAAPVFIPATFDAQVYVKDAPIAPVALPAATGGNAPLSYALTGPGAATTLTLPDGISWTRPSGTNTGGTLSGTPTAVAAQATYTLTATDADDDAATLTFTLEVQDDATPDFGTATIANQSWKRYRAITAFTLPAATGGNGSLSYALSPDLPTGVTYDTVHRVSGTPSVALAATSYTWTATDADGDTATLTFTITVADNSLPAFQVLAPKDRVYTRYKQAGGTLPPAIGGDAPLTYTLSRALPAGMARSASPGRTPGGPPVDTANRSYAGAPTAAMSKTSYAWTVTDADGDQAVWDFTLTVLDNGAPDFGAAAVADQSWIRRRTITAFTLPAATGGDGSVSYALSPALPAGVAKDAGHRVSGAPDAALARTEYTWTATDGDGDQDSLTFYVTVADRPAAALVLTPATIDESGTGNATTVTATLDKAASAATTVTVSAAAGTNAEAGDFTLSTAKTLTIAAGATTSTGTVTITAVDNADAEPDKSVTVSGSVDNDDVAAPAAVTLTIADDDRPSTPTLYVDSPKVAEGGPGDPSQSNSLTWTVTLAPASDQEVRVSIALDQEAGTATAGTYQRAAEGADHGFPSTPQLVFPPGETSRKIKVSVHGDSTAEPDETVVLALSGPVNAALDATSATGTILDDDTPAVTLAVADSSIAEAGGTTTVTATLSQASGAATTVTVTAVTGAYTVGSDATITIAAGETANASDTVTITAVNDDVDNVGDRSVTVTGTAQNSQGVGTVTGAALTLTDDEATPTATLVLSAETIDEHDGSNPGKATVTATLNRASSEAVTLTVAAAAGTNAAAGDFSLSDTTTLTVAAGATSSTGTVTVTAVDDTTDAPDKEVTVTAAVSGDSGIAAPASVTLTIEDDEAAPGVTLAVADSAIAENGGSTTVTATLSHASSAATTITVTAVDGSYTVGDDATIEIAAGETANAPDTVTITAVDDDVDNVGDRSVTVTGTAQNGQGVGTVTGAALTLTDDEATPTATLVLSAETIDEHDGSVAGSATVTTSLDRASSEAVTLTVAAAAGTNAVAGDFSLSSTKTLSIAAGATSSTGTVTVTAVDNTIDAPDKEVTVTAAVSGDSGIAAPAAQTLTIKDDEAAPGVTLALADSAINENGGSTTVTATLSHASSAATTITVQPVTGAYTVGSDATITIAAGETANEADSVTITTVNDAIDNVGNRTVTVSGTAQNGQGVGTVTGASLTLTDDEATPTATLALSAETIDEHDGSVAGSATVTASLNRASSEAVTLTVAAAAGTNAVAGDFSLSSTKTLSIAAGATSSTGTVTVTAVDDTTDAPDKEVTVTAAVSGDSGIAAPAAQTLTIEDDEAAPGVTLALADSAINENGGTTTVTATLSHASSAATTITVQPVTGAYTVGTAATIEIAAGETANASDSVTITAENDAINNVGGQPVTVGGAAQNSHGVGTVTGASLTFKGRLVLNRETGEAAPGVTLAVADSAIAENGGTTTVTATLSHASSAATTITVQPVSGAYTVGSDATIEIAAGETANTADTATITAVNDDVDNVGDRSVTVSGTAQNSQGVGTVTGASLTLTDDEATPTVTLALSAETIDEHDGANPGKATVTATLNRASSEAVTLTVAAAAGTNAAAGDFSLSSAKTLSIAAGATTSTGTVTVTAVDDPTDAPDKEVTVTAAVSGDSGIAAPASVTLTIEDDEAAPGVTLAVTDSSVAENGGTTTVTATLSHASSAATTITVQPVTGAYTVGLDATITIAAGATANAADTATITAVNDDVDNVGNRTVTVSGTAQNGQGVGTVTGASLTLTDDEATPTVTLALSPETIDEHDGSVAGSATVTATLNRASSEAVTLTVSAAAGTNAAAGDFSLSSAKTLSIAAGATSSTGTVTVTAVDNAVDAPDKEVTVTAAVSGDSGIAAPASVMLTIEDDEAAPGVTLAVADSAIAENGGSTTVTATLSHASSEATTITVTVVDGSYTVGDDATIEIAAGETVNADTVTITAVNDDVDNVDDRSVTVSGTAQNSHGVGTVTGAALTLTDDEATPTATLALSAETIDEHDGTNPGKATVTATLNRASSEAVTLTVAAAAGTNAAAGDFSLSSAKTLSIAAGATSSTGTVTVTAVDNTTDAPDKEVTVTAALSGDSGIAAPASVTLTIEDDEAAPGVTLAVADSAIAENGGTTTVTATLSHASSAATTITVQPVTGAYTVGSDATIEIAAGETANEADSVTITTVNDAINNLGGPTVTVGGTAQNSHGVQPVTGARLALTGKLLLDRETGGAAPGVTLAVADSAIAENGGTTTVTATLSHASSAATTITVQPVSGAYTVGSDATIEIAAGETANTADTVTITAVNDDVDNVGNRTATVSGTAQNGQGVGTVTGAALTLTDDEATPTATLVLSAETIDEHDGTNPGKATVTATLNRASSEAVTLTVAAAAGTNAATGDFSLSSTKTLSIAAGATTSTGTVTVTAVDNTADAPDKEVTVTAAVSGDSGIAAPAAKTLTIEDDEAAPGVTLAVADSSIAENGGTTTVTATLSHASSAATTITVTAVDGSYTVGEDATIEIAAGETANAADSVTITAVNDDVDNVGDRSVTVSGTAQNSQGVGTVTGAALMLTDDEATPTATLALSAETIDEHDGTNPGKATVTASLNRASSEAVTLTVAVAAGTNAVAGDFNLSSAKTLSIAAGATSSTGTVTVTAVDDTVDAPDKEVTVTAAVSGDSGVAAPAAQTLTIEDDEAAPGVTLAVTDSSVAENGGTTTVTATLSHASSAATTITVQPVTGAYTVGSDATITIAAGATANTADTATITAVNDDVDNVGNRTVTVSGTAQNGQGVGTVTGASLTLTDDEATPTATLALSAETIDEHDGTNPGKATVTASLNRASSEAVTLTVAAAAGTNAAAGDFSLSSAKTLSIAAGATSSTGTVTVTAVDNTVGRAGQGSDGNGDGERGQRDSGPGERDADDRGRRSGAWGDAGGGRLVDRGERRYDDGDGHAEPCVERGDDDHRTAGVRRLHGGAGRDDHDCCRGDGEHGGHGDDHGGERRDRQRGQPHGDGERDGAEQPGRGNGDGSEPHPHRRRGNADRDAGAESRNDRRARRVGRWVGDGDGDVEPSVERGGDADGDCGGWDERGGGRLQPVEHEDAEHRGRGDQQHRNGDGDGGRQHDGRAGQGSDGNGGGERGQRDSGPGERNADDRGRRSGAWGDAGGDGQRDRRERRLHHGDRHAEPSVERRDDDHRTAGVGRLHGGVGRDDHDTGRERRRRRRTRRRSRR